VWWPGLEFVIQSFVGDPMIRNKSFLFVLLLAAFALSSCSGVKGGGCVANCTVNGQTGNLVITVTSKPAVQLPNIAILSAAVDISGVTVTDSASNTTPLTLAPTVFPLDMNRLQSDSAYLGSFSLTATTYSAATITFSAPVLTVLNNTGATINGTCLTSNVCEITLAAGSAQLTGSPLFTVSSSQPVGISLNLDLSTALTLTNNALALSFSTVGAVTTAALPRTGAPTGDLDLIEDFVGQVTAVNSTSVSVTASNGVSEQFTLPTSPVIFDPQGLCGATPTVGCLTANQTLVSVNASVTTAGVLTLISADVLDSTPKDEVQGTLFFANSAGPFSIVLTNKFVSSGNSTLTTAEVGDVFAVTLSNPSFLVDTDEFTGNGSTPPSIFTTAFSNSAGFINGQSVMLHAVSATGAKAQNNQALTTDQVRLRFTRTFGALPAAVSGATFQLSGFPPNIGLQGTPIVNTVLGITNFDGVADVSQLAGGNIVSVRALLINSSPNFYAAKVRLQ
jgi:hypothetical protein